MSAEQRRLLALQLKKQSQDLSEHLFNKGMNIWLKKWKNSEINKGCTYVPQKAKIKGFLKKKISTPYTPSEPLYLNFFFKNLDSNFSTMYDFHDSTDTLKF